MEINSKRLTAKLLLWFYKYGRGSTDIFVYDYYLDKVIFKKPKDFCTLFWFSLYGHICAMFSIPMVVYSLITKKYLGGFTSVLVTVAVVFLYLLFVGLAMAHFKYGPLCAPWWIWVAAWLIYPIIIFIVLFVLFLLFITFDKASTSNTVSNIKHAATSFKDKYCPLIRWID